MILAPPRTLTSHPFNPYFSGSLDVLYHFPHVLLTAMTNHCISFNLYFVILSRLRISVYPDPYPV